jgi:hypothetical protein
MAKTHERIQFRLLHMHCCGHLLCWVNPRLPSYCPECGRHVYPNVREDVRISDSEAHIIYDENALKEIH